MGLKSFNLLGVDVGQVRILPSSNVYLSSLALGSMDGYYCTTYERAKIRIQQRAPCLL